MATNLKADADQARDRDIDRIEWLIASGHRWLQFPRDLEQDFSVGHAASLLGYRRRVVLMAFLVMLAAGALDILFISQSIDDALLLRYAVVAPLAGLFVLFAHSRWFPAAAQLALCAYALLLSGLLFGLMMIGDGQVVVLYSPGFLLLAVFSGMLLHLRFWLAFLLLAVMGAVYLVLMVRVRPQPLDTVIAYSLFYATAALIALFASYHIEYMARRQFLQTRLLALKQTELELANEKLQELAELDGLTGLANRRHFDQQLEAEWSRAKRTGQPLSVMLIDLDYFKRYNDTYGHQAGDDCLIVVGSVLRSHAQRSGDVAARYGGEEFVLILPMTGCRDAADIAGRVVRDLEAFRIPHRASAVGDVVTASAGVACCVPAPFLTPRDLLQAADAALYRAKENGRNRVVVAEPLTPGE